jgi:predicted nuclease of predicted toxin-antitoxin system
VKILVDMNFAAIIALTRDSGPSIILVRAPDMMASGLPSLVIQSIKVHAASLETGAIPMIDMARSRLRLLPLKE